MPNSDLLPSLLFKINENQLALESAIMELANWAEQTGATEIADTVHVAARAGVVTLSGSAVDLRDRELAVATAWSAPGTMAVENHIRIS